MFRILVAAFIGGFTIAAFCVPTSRHLFVPRPRIFVSQEALMPSGYDPALQYRVPQRVHFRAQQEQVVVQPTSLPISVAARTPLLVLCCMVQLVAHCAFHSSKAVNAGRAGGRWSELRDDPLASPRGPRDDSFPSPSGPPLSEFAQSQPPDPDDQVDAETRTGARVVGAGLGGYVGNNVYTGLAKFQLLSCSPFNLDACAAATAARDSVTQPTKLKGVGFDMDTFPFADILRNPTSILPGSWQLYGRRYLSDLPADDLPAAAPPPLNLPAASESTPPPIPSSSEVDALREELAKQSTPPPIPSSSEVDALREELAKQLQELDALREQAQSSQVVPPPGVLPASAAEPQLMGFVLDQDVGALPPSLLDSASFAALAEGSDGNIFATLVSAAIGAVLVEYLATTKDPPIPDPLLGGLWGTLHTAARVPSKLTGKVATKAVDAVKRSLPFQADK